MRHALALSILTGVSAGSASADPAALVTQAWDRFQNICTAAMADPQGFIDNVPTWAPADSYGASSSEDGKMYTFRIFQDRFVDAYGVTVMRAGWSDNCSTTLTDKTLKPAETAARAFRSLIEARHGDAEIVGGRNPELYRERNYEAEPTFYHGPVLKNPDDFQFSIGGLFDDPRQQVFVQIVSEYMSISRTRFRETPQ